MELAMYEATNPETLNPWWMQADKQKGGFCGSLYVSLQEGINPPAEPLFYLAHVPLHLGLPLTEVQPESFQHGEASPALQHLLVIPGKGQPCERPGSAETFMVPCKGWHFLTLEGALFESLVNGDKLATWSYDVQNGNEKEEQGQLFGFQDMFIYHFRDLHWPSVSSLW